MNYLFRYLQLLTPGELDRLSGIALAPRERQVLDTLINLRTRVEPERGEAVDRIGISSAHFDKICSLLLRQVYAAVVPQGGMALLYDLNRRSLQANFLHELRRQEKAVQAASISERCQFYMDSIGLLARVSRKDFNEALMAKFAAKYDALRPSPDNAIVFEAYTIGAAIWSAAARGENTEKRMALAERLRVNAERLTPTTGPLALYRHYHAMALFHAQIDEIPAERLRYLELAAAVSRKHPGTVSEEEDVLLRCRIAESYYFNGRDFRRAYRLYATLYRAHAGVLAREYYHTVKFVQLAIILGHERRAEQLLRAWFGRHVMAEHESIGTMGAITWAKLLLASGRAAEAKPYIDLGVQRNNKNTYVQYEIELRILETLYFIMIGDLDFADHLAARNIRYLRSKGFTLASSRYYPWLFKLLMDRIAAHNTMTPLPAELVAKLEEFNEGPAALYGLLLRRAMEAIGAMRQK